MATTDSGAAWDDISFVISSTYRAVVMQSLADRAATPSQIAEATDVGIAHVSRSLQELRERDMVDLLVSEDRKKGRVYGLTDEGRPVAEHEQVTDVEVSA